MENSQKKFNTKTLVEMALLVAVVIIMGTTPLGTIRTPLLTISLVTIPVAIGAIIIGPLGGLVCGAAFGITSFINALTGASGMLSILFEINPFGVFVTAVVARCLEGYLVGLIFLFIHKTLKVKKASYYIAAVCCPILNTILFMGSLCAFFYGTDYVQGLVETFGASNPFTFVIAIVGVQGVIEACTCLVIGGAVAHALSVALKRG